MGKFLKDIFSDDTGKYSFTRVMSFIMLIWTIAIDTYISIKKGEFVDIPIQIAIIIASLYGINKGVSIFARANNQSKENSK